MADSEEREDYAADDDHSEQVTQAPKKERGHGEHRSDGDDVTPQLRKRDADDQ